VIDRKVFDEQERGEILSVATDFPKLWNDPKTPNRERKRMAHLILEDVTLSRGIEVTMHVRFKGGLTQTLTVPLAQNGWKKYMTAPEIITEIDHLLNDHTTRRSLRSSTSGE
jgi:hypothetical protein